ncbi:inactive peptidyl-prolyl cis-trans isomerase FKBP6-like [Brachionichthys hirsutus]|uniref:inactive peptidyl-prolyl cis-trans isomerase FKBP6-like n=1 Tax=Brachionichthys hirsutus TaxID=412623 RepID=UPI0036052203
MPGNGLEHSIRRLMINEQPGTTPFHYLREHMEDLLGDGGILKQVIKPGEGPPVPQNASVLMRYSGFLEHSPDPFETTRNFKYPQMMKLGRDVTLAGLEMGLLTMRKDEFSRFLFQPQYAYGELGCPPLIPAAAVILYDVQVVDFFYTGQMDDFVSLSLEEQIAAPVSTLLQVVGTVRSLGNRCFSQRRYDNAKDRYKQAAKLLKNRERNGDAEMEKITAALLPLFLNLSITELRLDSPSKALKYGKNALEIESTNTKALFRCGQAYLELREYKSAMDCLTAAQAKKPFDSDINNLLREAAICHKCNLDREKDMCSKMFRDLRDKWNREQTG